MKKLLSVFLALVMAVSALAVSGAVFAADANRVKVEFSVFDEGVFTMQPQTISVTADLDDKYADAIGYADTIDEPSILDAIIKAHIVLFGEDFMEYVPIKISNQDGYPMFTSVFGESTNALGYRVNGAGAMSPDEPLKDGDCVEFYFYQDKQFYSDKYLFFDSRYVTVKPNQAFTLTLNAEDYDEDWNLSVVPAAEMEIVNSDYDSLGTTDENGQISLSFDKLGTYGITAIGYYENDYDEYEIFAPWCTVTVTNDLNDYIAEEMNGAADYLLNDVSEIAADDAYDFVTYLKSGADLYDYEDAFVQSVKSNLDENGGKLVSSYTGSEDIGLYGAAIQAVDMLGYVPSDFYGYDLVSAFEAVDLSKAVSNPYFYRVAIEAAKPAFAKTLAEDFINKYYTSGAGMNYYGYACDNTAIFVTALAPVAKEFPEIYDDALTVLGKYVNENGAFYSFEYNDISPDSTALAMMAYAAAGDVDKAFQCYKNLVEGFESSVGVFQYYGEDSAYATKDALMALGYFQKAVKDNSYEHPEHVYKTTVTPATYEEDGEEVTACVICGEIEKTTVIPKLVKNGWLKENGSWYYYTDDVAATGWKKVNGKWYYMNADGVMQTGWVKVNGKWYYLKASGAMATGWQKVDGKWYYLKASGAMATGWQKVDGKWYYLKASGAMATGWQKVDGKWYYLDKSGAMVTGTKTINGKKYTFNKSGVCQNP